MSGKEGNVAKHGRHDRLLKEHVHDPYMTRSKPTDPTVCSECGVVFSEGRWQWLSAIPESPQHELCPACQRIRDKVPAGILSLSGAFFQQHRDEIMRLVDNKVEEQKAQHPMKRLMAVEDQGENVVITFTDVHLPRGVGEAIERAYDGELDIHYTEEAGIVRVYWQR
ncbi:BCAM0308 family protein [Methylomarinum sp. Ch1-1]|uniref:BCAM0308 family protein n=1 Tax=Methylomarinum roseum TaxID=3067653 RepID=A0AAU7NS77_9GAMM|nr:BCAM0308 family protein [Methylomarinum sp. Ch1-1]MDP4520218.1 BCAM0308 family protein [Methylomarinum sp. Ch1-1]